MRRLISALLALMMLAPVLAACSDDPALPADDSTADAAAETTVPVETAPAETARADAKDNLPEDMNLGGKSIGILFISAARKNDFDGGGEETGDTVNDAVLQRTRNVEERLNFTFELTEIAGKWSEFGKQMEQNIMAGDDLWQMVITPGNASIGSGRDYLFQDLSNNKYIDPSQPWWWEEPIREMSLDGKKIRYLIGDICLSNYTTTGAMYFNKNLLIDNNYNPDELYQMVIDRKWTYDKLQEMSASMYDDLNGDGQVNAGDTYGLVVINAELIRHMEFTGNVRHYSRDENGYPYLDYDKERAVLLIDTLNRLLYETKGNEYRDASIEYTTFAGGSAAFYAGRLSYATTAAFREMEDDYGIIPYPMLDLEQGEYNTLIHSSNRYVTVPITCKTPDEAGAVIEAMCSESYRVVVEPFFESALKMKYARDSYSGQCIDIIRDTARKYFVNDYNAVVKGGTMITDQVKKNQNTFASAYAAQKEATDKNIQNLVEKYIKADADLAG